MEALHQFELMEDQALHIAAVLIYPRPNAIFAPKMLNFHSLSKQ